MAKIITGDRIGKTARLSSSVSGFIFGPNRQSLLLIQRRDNGLWCLPSGAMEPGETVVEACSREVREETGHVCQFVKLLGVWSNPNMVMTYPDGNKFQMLEIDLELRVTAMVSGAQETDEALRWRYVHAHELEDFTIMESEIERIKLALAGESYIK